MKPSELLRGWLGAALAAVLVGVAVAFWVFRPPSDIGSERAASIATASFRQYLKAAQESADHFEGPQLINFDDGREYRWTYLPCPETGELRIFVALNGEARFPMIPDCMPLSGFSRPAQTV